MKFHALLPVRDEADVVGQCLRQLLTWADAIYVFDTGSMDETWEIVQQFAADDKRVIPLVKDDVFFSDKIVRGWIFHQARRWMRAGDWFLRVDADEFHHVAPPEFVKRHMKPYETVAFHQYDDFRLISSEVRDWEESCEPLRERSRPIEERRRWFTTRAYTEPRLCRYRESMQWPEMVSFPYNAGYAAAERLPIRHYPHRDPDQLDRRCRVRAAMMSDPENACVRHWNLKNWREHVVPDDSPELCYWQPGVDLPALHLTNHLSPAPKRMLQRAAHAWFLPFLDKLRTRYSTGAYPRRIPATVIEKLTRELDRNFVGQQRISMSAEDNMQPGRH